MQLQGNQSSSPVWSAPGQLVAFPVLERKKTRMLDAFYRPVARRDAPVLVFVHGMGSNFYRSQLKKAFMETAPRAGYALLSFNNRGAERGTEDEKFRQCLADLDAAAAFARGRGHRQMVFIGHSTGCQKIVYWHAQRRPRNVAGLVLLAPADDYAITRQHFGRRFDRKVAWARKMVAQGQGDRPISGRYERFTAERFLSIANVRATEANVFRYEGSLTQFRRIRCPMLAVFGELEEFAVISPADMLAILQQKNRSRHFTDWLIPNANHSFKGSELDVARAVCGWAHNVFK